MHHTGDVGSLPKCITAAMKETTQPTANPARAAPLAAIGEGSAMTKEALILACAGVLAVGVVGLGFAGRFQPADLHQFDYLMGLPTATATAADCNDHSAS